MIVRRHLPDDHRNECMNVNNHEFRRVQQFKYLGALNEIGMKLEQDVYFIKYN